MSTTAEGIFTVEGTELYTKTWTVCLFFHPAFNLAGSPG